MTQEKQEYFKQKLLNEKERLEQELRDLGHEDPKKKGHFEANYPESGGDSEDDNAQEISEYVDDLSIEARAESELKDVLNALAAIEKGTYGICKYCAKEIDEKRLDARPASSSCIDCKKILTQEM
ncbi:MAG: RNA polymerase-binding protein DksA [Patescibacteria group bacterium]